MTSRADRGRLPRSIREVEYASTPFYLRAPVPCHRAGAAGEWKVKCKQNVVTGEDCVIEMTFLWKRGSSGMRPATLEFGPQANKWHFAPIGRTLSAVARVDENPPEKFFCVGVCTFMGSDQNLIFTDQALHGQTLYLHAISDDIDINHTASLDGFRAAMRDLDRQLGR